jgi:hypothetical protein
VPAGYPPLRVVVGFPTSVYSDLQDMDRAFVTQQIQNAINAKLVAGGVRAARSNTQLIAQVVDLGAQLASQDPNLPLLFDGLMFANETDFLVDSTDPSGPMWADLVQLRAAVVAVVEDIKFWNATLAATIPGYRYSETALTEAAGGRRGD